MLNLSLLESKIEFLLKRSSHQTVDFFSKYLFDYLYLHIIIEYRLIPFHCFFTASWVKISRKRGRTVLCSRRFNVDNMNNELTRRRRSTSLRSNRTSSGKCYHMFSSGHFSFQLFSPHRISIYIPGDYYMQK